MACPLDAIDALSTVYLLDGVEATFAHPHAIDASPALWTTQNGRKSRKKKGLDWNNLGGHEPARFRVVGQVLDAPERLREVVEALS